MSEEINRPRPLEDWEKALLLTAIAEGRPARIPSDQLAKWLARLTDWPLQQAEHAITEAMLKGMIMPETGN